MGKYRVVFSVDVTVEVDESKFTPQFMDEFRDNFYQFDSLEDHLEHIAQLEMRGLLQDFTEGYGPIKEMGIDARLDDWTLEAIEQRP